MPKAQKLRRNGHHASVKKATEVLASDEALNDSPTLAVVATEIPTLPAQSSQLTKKEKQQEKRTAFLQKLDPSGQTFSKSHERRLKRKARDQLAGETLDDLSSAIATMEKEAMDTAQTIAEAKEPEMQNQKKPQSKAGVIGEGKSQPLSKAQRKRAFKLERLRHPLILKNPEFTANPFQTIRTHAQNTLLKHTPS
ncbi:ribosome biogenesis protein SLX9-domain-containing protein [Crepidotus variabilis]|uniref:Ribosome biogenesis protein SLX9 n=1 Tax=Crepidotus variabilis TaxID=179855 RepID=A0A9P6JTL9_9AGAR|nr:ribosome biogenesis protein SLX9-domain-containing protein [Crepidotus variabilis]